MPVNRLLRGLAAAAVLILTLAAAGCGGHADGPPAATPTTADRVPPAPEAGRALLRIDGRAQASNTPDGLALDRRELEHLGLRTISLDEPFKKRRMSFRAVPLSRVIDLARPTSTSSTAHGVALNDYVVDIPLDVARGDGVWLATRRGDGSRIPVAEGGPIRVVFADGAKGAGVENYWIWSLDELELR